MACASAPESAPASAGDSDALSALTVETQGETTVLGLVGPAAPAYTAFRKSDPERVVLELADVAPGAVESPRAVYDGTVSEVRVEPRETAGEAEGSLVEVHLAREVAYEVTPGDRGLELRLTPEAADPASSGAAEAAAPSEDPWAGPGEGPERAGTASGAPASEAETGEAESGEPDAGAATAAAEAAEEAPPATVLRGVLVPEEGAALELETDGRVESMSRFVVEDPLRLVIDLPGLESRVPSSRIDVGRDGVARVRIGQHPEKVRVVLDAGEGADSFETVRLVRAPQGLRVALRGEEAATDEIAADEIAADEAAADPAAAELAAEESPAAPAAPAEGEPEPASDMASAAEPVEPESAQTAEAPAAGEPGTVYGVQFDGQAERDRVVVLTEGAPDYRVTEVDSETVVVRLLGATIDPDAAVRVAPDGPGPVSLVTAFQQPEVATPEVRVVIRRAEGLEPEIERKGGFLFVDFPRGEELAGEVPAFREGSAPAGAGSAADAAPDAPSTSTASAKASAQAREEAAPAAPAAVQRVDDPIEVLEEGGLVEGKQYTGRRISLDFKDVEIDDVLRLIAEVSNLNIIAGDDVKGKVTIRLVDVPWDQALDVILLTKGLGFTRVGNVLRIAPSGVLKAEEEARLQERRAKEKLEDLVVKLQPVNYADAGNVKGLVQRLLTSRGSVQVDKRTNTVILKDIPSVIDEATALIKAVDTQTPQVLIEARIVEASLDFSRSLGSSFSFGTQEFVDPLGSASTTRTDIDMGDDVLFDPTANNVSVSNPIGSATGLLNLGAFLIDERFNIDVTLQAAETNEEVKIVSSPRIVTLDNQKATIESGQEIPFQSGISDGGATQLQFEEAKTKLEVTPHITPNRSIVMEVKVEKSSVSQSVQSSTGDPAIDTNEANARTLVKDGQTLVIGGLQSVTNQDNESRVPFLHMIPILGNAFKNKVIVDERTELLIFVTPRIVQSPEVGA